MKPSNILFISFFLLLITSGLIKVTESRPTKLFVFGDSYADTGNLIKAIASSWRNPYGITFPGRPTGRFSDGRVFTDYFVRFLGFRSPIPYRWMKLGGKKIKSGMNFAYGGSGVFDTFAGILPNMSTQMDFFETLMNESVYTKHDLHHSVVLVSLSGNDYGFYLDNGGTDQGLQIFIPRVINQLEVNLRRIRDLGATKIAVTGLQPLGCLPQRTMSNSYQQCNATQNTDVNFHNLLLQQAVARLNNETRKSTIFILDLFNSFTTALNQRDSQGFRFESSLRPCCMGMSSDYSCGSSDTNGTKFYTVCSDPKTAFFWDSAHPTEAGWRAVYMNLKSSLEQFFKY